MHVLVLESSTSSAKGMLYDTRNNTYELETGTYTKKYDDVTLHDAETVFNDTVTVARKVCFGKKVDIIVLSGIWHSLLLCDQNMNPRTPVYLWAYTGAAALCRELRKDEAYVREYYSKTGCMVNGTYPAFKLLFLKERGYPLSDYFIEGQGTYNTFKLTGKRVVMDSMASGTGLLNIHTKKFDSDILADIGIEESQLGKLIAYDETYPLSKKGAEFLGLAEGIPVISAAPDGGLNQIGAGALNDGVMTFSVGTSGAMRVTAKRPVIPEIPSIWCYLSPATWLSGAATAGAANCVDWFVKNFLPPGASYKTIETGLVCNENTPIFLPFLFGERCPGWEDGKNAVFLDIKPFHTQRDLYQGLLEGILFNLFQCYTILTRINGVPKKIKLSGGILNSHFWTQMCVNIFQREMEVDNIEHSSMLGGMVLGRKVLGEIKDLTDFESESIKVFSPNPLLKDQYDLKYNRYKYWYNMIIN